MRKKVINLEKTEKKEKKEKKKTPLYTGSIPES